VPIPNLKKYANSSVFTEKEATAAIADYCSKKEVCIADAKKKLVQWAVEPAVMERVVAWLVQNKFIDELRFSEAFVRDKFRFNKWGKYKIRTALQLKSIPESIIEQALVQIPAASSANLLDEEIKKKLKSIKSDNPYEIKSKLYRFGMSRGFESDLVMSAIDRLVKIKD